MNRKLLTLGILILLLGNTFALECGTLHIFAIDSIIYFSIFIIAFLFGFYLLYKKKQKINGSAMIFLGIFFFLIWFFNVTIIVDCFDNNNPMDEAKKNVRNLVNDLGVPKKIGQVTFKSDAILAAKPIAEGTRELSSDQVCVLIGNSLENNNNFQYEGIFKGSVIAYKEKLTQHASLWMLCSRANEIRDDISDNGLDLELNIDDCEGGFKDLINENSSSRVCVVGVAEESE